MKLFLENFRKFKKSVSLISENISDMVEKYYSDLPEEEKREKVLLFTDKLNKNIEKYGNWITKTTLHSLEQRMIADKKKREASPEEREASKDKMDKLRAISSASQRKYNQKYGRKRRD